MNIDKYALKAESSFTTFEFISEGPKGLIPKIVQFQKTNRAGIYNLAFGDKSSETGRIDDLIVSDNDDSEKVLATVIGALYAFFDKHPYVFVYATGSTNARTRLYRIGITHFYHQMSEDFNLYGQIGDKFYEFELNKDYAGFLVQRKFL